MRDSLTVEHFAVGPLGCTCTIVADAASGEAIVVDGGDEAEAIAARLDALGVRARYLVHSHAHVDHIGCLGTLRELTGAQGLLHHADLPLYATVREQARWLGMREPSVVALDGDLRDGDRFSAGQATLEVLHTPGHTPGSVSFALSRPGRATLLLSGDTLFRGSVGRTDIGGTTLEELVGSIRDKLLAFPDDTIVVPGHGPVTTIGQERLSNPFLS
jgi:glyoxylase-like metal-dependent hydrolase (beta-lactamase superfamily II)